MYVVREAVLGFALGLSVSVLASIVMVSPFLLVLWALNHGLV